MKEELERLKAAVGARSALPGLPLEALPARIDSLSMAIKVRVRLLQAVNRVELFLLQLCPRLTVRVTAHTP
jgi:hypothetical protein